MIDCLSIETRNQILDLPISRSLEDALESLNIPQVLETDELSFTIISKEQPSNIAFWIQDIEFDSLDSYESSGGYKCSFPSSGEKRRLFLNHFGLSVIAIVYLSDSGTHQVVYSCVEVLARKLNAENAEKMLECLENSMESITQACFSATSRRFGQNNEVEKPPVTILQEITRNLNIIESCLSDFMYSKRSRLLPQKERMSLKEPRAINYSTIHWLLQNVSALTPSTPLDLHAIPLATNKYYTIDEIEVDVLHNNTDVYENQVTMGFLHEMLATLSAIESYYKKVQDDFPILESSEETIPVGYQSIEQLRLKFFSRYCEKQLEACYSMKDKLHKIILFFQKNLPVSKHIRGMPKFSQGFLVTTHYRKIFSCVVSWYRLGSPSFEGDKFLLGIKTIDKLYEFFCLFNLIKALEDAGFILSDSKFLEVVELGPSAPFSKFQPHNIYWFRNRKGESIKLFYEPHISTSGFGELIDTYHDGFGRYSRWTPDFLVEYTKEEKKRYIVLDSKYMNEENAMEQLRVMTIKYLHGIGLKSGGVSPILALFALFPTQKRHDKKHKFIHNSRFDLFSDNPSLPSLGLLKTLISDSFDNMDGHLTKILVRIIQVMRASIREQEHNVLQRQNELS